MAAVLTLAMLSNDVYAPIGIGAGGFRRVVDRTLDKWNNTGSSFFGAAYTGGATGIIAFRGSADLQDWTDADVDIAMARTPISQTGDAFAFFNSAKQILVAKGARRIIVTGHSLGGGLTQLIAAHITTFPVVGVTFNAPCMAGFAGPVRISTANSNAVYNYRADRDPVSLKGTHIGRHPVSVAGGGMHPIGPLINALSTGGTGMIHH